MELFNYVLPGLAVATFLGLAYGYFQKAKAEAVISLQAEEIQALQTQNSRLKEDNKSLLAENSTLKNSNQDLKDLAQQTPDIRILTNKIADVAVSVADITKYLGIIDGKKSRTTK